MNLHALNSLTKIQNLFFFLFLLFLPNQLGLHFWPSWTIVQGLRIDYLSPTFYLTYFLIIAFLLYFLIGRRDRFSPNPKAFLVVIFIVALVVSSGGFGPASLLKIDQLLLTLAFALAVMKSAKSLTWAWVGLPLALLWTSLLVFIQFFLQQSLGLWILGERAFSLATPGIARSEILGQLSLRPYATFSHPNSLAGFLLIGLLLTLFLGRRLNGLFLRFVIPLSTMALVLTGSRSSIALGILALLLVLFRKFLSRRALIVIVFLLLSLAAFSASTIGFDSADQSLSRRDELQRFALSTLTTNPLFGLGLNNFIPKLGSALPSVLYPSLSSPVIWLQPVHNVYLLILSETGIIGFVFIVIFLIRTLQKSFLRSEGRYFYLLLCLLIILLTSFFDHYWFTLLQNQLLAAVVFGLVWSKSLTA